MISSGVEGVWRGCGLVGLGSDDNAKRSAPMGLRWAMLLLGLGIRSTCTIVPSEPSVLVLQAIGKSMDTFQAEEGACRFNARHQLGGAPEQTASTMLLQMQYDRPYNPMYARQRAWGAWRRGGSRGQRCPFASMDAVTGPAATLSPHRRLLPQEPHPCP